MYITMLHQVWDYIHYSHERKEVMITDGIGIASVEIGPVSTVIVQFRSFTFIHCGPFVKVHKSK